MSFNCFCLFVLEIRKQGVMGEIGRYVDCFRFSSTLLILHCLGWYSKSFINHLGYLIRDIQVVSILA